MLIIAICILFLVICLGLYLLTFVLQDKETPKGIVFIHGPLAFTGVGLLSIYAYLYQQSLFFSVILFLLAAFGGLILIYKDMTAKPIPKWLALIHGSVALLAFISVCILAYM